ncbi:unnamed protein product [Effrenium voratum]|nr:unnamed protein product [Effrenium voratum]
MLLSIRKVNGEVLEHRAPLEDTVSQLKEKIAEGVGVPPLCQRLWLNEGSPDIVARSLPWLRTRVEESVRELNRRDITEVKAWMRPPNKAIECLQVVQTLLCASDRVTIPTKKRGDPKDMSWNGCNLDRLARSLLQSLHLLGRKDVCQVKHGLLQPNSAMSGFEFGTACFVGANLRGVCSNARRLAQSSALGCVRLTCHNLCPIGHSDYPP